MSESLHLSVGDRVVYPNQGLCTVEEIKAEHIAGHDLVFVSLVFAQSGARVKVPEAKLVKNGVRRVATRDEVRDTFAFLTSDGELASLDWKKRAADNTKLLTTGGLIGLAKVVKTLAGLTDLRPLPPKERDQYDDARHLLVHELAAALEVSPADAEDALDLVLFPVGKERPKRSAADFKVLADDELGGELLGLDDEVPEISGERDVADVEADSPAGDEAVSHEGPASSTPKAKGGEQATASGERRVEAGTGARKPKAPRAGRPKQAKLEETDPKASAAGPEVATASAATGKRGRTAAAPPSDLDLTRTQTQTAAAASVEEPLTKTKRGRAKKTAAAAPRAADETAAEAGIRTKTEVAGPTEPGLKLEKTATEASSTKRGRAPAGDASKARGRAAGRGGSGSGQGGKGGTTP